MGEWDVGEWEMGRGEAGRGYAGTTNWTLCSKTNLATQLVSVAKLEVRLAPQAQSRLRCAHNGPITHLACGIQRGVRRD